MYNNSEEWLNLVKSKEKNKERATVKLIDRILNALGKSADTKKINALLKEEKRKIKNRD